MYFDEKNTLSTQLNGLYFAKDSSGKWGYKVGGAGSVTPFKSQADIDNAKNSVTLSVSGRTVTASNGKSVTIPYGGSSRDGTATITTKDDNGTETFDIADGYISKIVVVHFKAYIKVSFNKSGNFSNVDTVTISNGSVSYSITKSANASDFSNGYYTFTIGKQGNWTITDGYLSKTINANSTGTTYTVDLTYLDININYTGLHKCIKVTDIYSDGTLSPYWNYDDKFAVLIPKNNHKLRYFVCYGGGSKGSGKWAQACAARWAATLTVNSKTLNFTNLQIPTYDQLSQSEGIEVLWTRQYNYASDGTRWTSTKYNDTEAYTYRPDSKSFAHQSMTEFAWGAPIIVYEIKQ